MASLTFVAPLGGLFALFVFVPLAAFAVTAARASRARALLRLDSPGRKRHVALGALVAIPLLLGLAAAEPVLQTHVGHRVRAHTQAIFVFDTSRSMAAAAAADAPNRFAQARAAAIRLRDRAIPDVPSGVASLTTQLLPHLFPTADETVFDSTVERVLGIERPPPPALEFGLTGTSFRPLDGLRRQGYFSPTATHRFAILLTDGESAQFDPDVVAQALTESNPQQSSTLPGGGFGAALRAEAPVRLFIVRFGSSGDHIYDSGRRIEPGYRPNPSAATIVRTLADDAHGRAFSAAELPAAAAALRKAVSAEKASLHGEDTKTIPLAPYVVLAALAALVVLLTRRNLTQL